MLDSISYMHKTIGELLTFDCTHTSFACEISSSLQLADQPKYNLFSLYPLDVGIVCLIMQGIPRTSKICLFWSLGDWLLLELYRVEMTYFPYICFEYNTKKHQSNWLS